MKLVIKDQANKTMFPKCVPQNTNFIGCSERIKVPWLYKVWETPHVIIPSWKFIINITHDIKVLYWRNV